MPPPGESTYGQDAHYHSTIRTFTKLDAAGNDLPLAPGLATSVRDNVTGLVWEVKTDDGTINDRDNMFTRCNPDSETNGGVLGECNPDLSGNLAGDSKQFIDTLNANNYGGFNDWRIPTAYELFTLIDWGKYNSLWVYFPNGQKGIPSTPGYLSNTWITRLYSPGALRINGYDGSAKTSGGYPGDYVRAVRGATLMGPDLIDSGNLTVTDQTTGLIWQKNIGVIGTNSYVMWHEAMQYCENLVQAGFDDWRLPDILESLSLVDNSYSEPAIKTELFDSGNPPSMVWTSTTVAENPNKAWKVSYNDGAPSNSTYKYDKGFVRCVRSGINSERYPSHTVTVNVVGNGEAQIYNFNSEKTYYACEDSCTINYKDGVRLNLVALTDSGDAFSGWSAGCDNEVDGICQVVVDRDMEFTATFSPNGDLDGDGQRGLAEVIMLLQELTGN